MSENKSALKQWYLQSMGIQVYRERGTETTLKPAKKSDSWQALQAEVSGCTLCPLHKTRTQTVFGVGNPKAQLIFVGEAPGQQEDLKGEPFVGRAGQLLDQMLSAIGLKREDVFIANILKCRPPNNRDPKPEERQSCTPYLLRQLEFIQPKLIVALGRVSAQYLLDTTTPLGKLRNRTHPYSDKNIPLLVTYHPAYLLRRPQDKAKAWEDLLLIQSLL